MSGELKCAVNLTISGELAAPFIEVCTEFDHVRLQKSIKSRS